MKPRPLIIGSADDPHVVSVVAELDKAGVASVVLNKSTLVKETLTSSVDLLRIGNVDLTEISSVWNRRALPVELPDSMDSRWKDWCTQEWNHAFMGLLDRLPVTWCSHPFAIKRASLKANQLHIAQAVGLVVPEYIITSDSSLARDFVSAYSHTGTVMKPLGRPLVGEFGSASSIFTNSTAALTDADWQSLRLCPCIFQRQVRRVAEVRITVVAERVFPVRIDTRSVSEIDYRIRDPYELPHETYDLPPSIGEACLCMLGHFGLRFGAFDFLLDAEGRLYFLELNANGQWRWIEDLTSCRIAKAIAEELTRQPDRMANNRVESYNMGRADVEER